MPEIERKIKIPPRRRSAVLTVDLVDGRTVKASVDSKKIRVSIPSPASNRYGSSGGVKVLDIPRSTDDLEAVRNLIDAAIDEVVDQDEFTRLDAESREGVPEDAADGVS